MDKLRRIDDTVERVVASLSTSSSNSTSVDFLHVDPNLSNCYNSTRSGVFEDLPENFLENISPQLDHHHSTSAISPQLVSLAPMSTGSDVTSNAFVTLVPMAAPVPYVNISSLKMEHHMNMPSTSTGHYQQSHHKSVGPASLLSPLHHIGADLSGGNVLIQQNGSCNSYIKMEMTTSLANAETPPAVSNVELASNIIASLIGDQPMPIGGQRRIGSCTAGSAATTSTSSSDVQQQLATTRTVYSTTDTTDPLNAEIDEDIYIDTKELCKRIAYELKQHSIPQAIFAERILCRSQGTLSDLLRNPKPWNKLKSGRETFRRMYNWVQQTLPQRLAILDLWKEGDDDNTTTTGIISTSSQSNTSTNGNHVTLQQSASIPVTSNAIRSSTTTTAATVGSGGGNNKRPRLVFTDIQKRTLQAIFKETQRPSREMQQTIAEHLRLDLSTVANFFMNARRRSRSGPLNQDEPAPYQQVRLITPPPTSPPPRVNASRQRAPKPTAPALLPHIEESVATVAEKAVEYSRRKNRFDDDDDDDEDDVDDEDEEDEDDMSEPESKIVKIDSNDDDNEPTDVSTNNNNNVDVGMTSSSSRIVVVTSSNETTATQRRSLPVMSFGKRVTVKVEREVPNSGSGAGTSTRVDNLIVVGTPSNVTVVSSEAD